MVKIQMGCWVWKPWKTPSGNDLHCVFIRHRPLMFAALHPSEENLCYGPEKFPSENIHRQIWCRMMLYSVDIDHQPHYSHWAADNVVCKEFQYKNLRVRVQSYPIKGPEGLVLRESFAVAVSFSSPLDHRMRKWQRLFCYFWIRWKISE